ncbi:LacI family DNA-binding transcriptional regulator [Streptomyces sp. RP5T]|uniref:LacI family DNA-binding transcriptional regulator n=1 Tax=Streptomyces sp. RP5T TaxID=2490848 RepID=UPI000F654610|nr:LacI family DNA-binding transcriptional regulator [Streptomyces sp. RP5T]RRR76197.1 LacI family transcriptional regulator [Streptomyces sp. RP5T]
MQVTIREVAKAAGVSRSTVSRVLDPDGTVSAVTRERVQAVAGRLGYQPNRAARGLITGRTGHVGVIVPDLLDSFFADSCKGVQARARGLGHAVFVSDAERVEGLELDAIRTMAPEADGIVLCAPHLSSEELQSLDRITHKPIVVLHRREPGLPSVTADMVEGMTDALTHLHALGHRRIAYVGGPRSTWTAQERAAGIDAMAESGKVEIIRTGSVAPHFDGGITGAADVVLASGATAVVAFNDIVAFGLISRFSAPSVQVPDEMSVVGCDDIALAGMAAPPLTTVGVAKAQAARAAVDLLFRILSTPAGEDAQPLQRTLPTHLVVRGSTAAIEQR